MGQATALQAGRCHLPENQSGTVRTRWTAGGAKLLTWDHLARAYVPCKAVCLEITCPFTIPTAIISRTVFDAALDFCVAGSPQVTPSATQVTQPLILVDNTLSALSGAMQASAANGYAPRSACSLWCGRVSVRPAKNETQYGLVKDWPEPGLSHVRGESRDRSGAPETAVGKATW
jgi:hypothetical protein